MIKKIDPSLISLEQPKSNLIPNAERVYREQFVFEFRMQVFNENTHPRPDYTRVVREMILYSQQSKRILKRYKEAIVNAMVMERP